MRRILSVVFLGVLVAEGLTLGQGSDAGRVLAAARDALGGEKKLTAVTSLTATGHNAQANGQTSVSRDFEMALVTPDKFMRKDTIGVMNGTPITRTSGFNGDGLVETLDTPPMGGGVFLFKSAGPGGVTSIGPGGGAHTPEQLAEIHKAGVLAAKQDFARLALGMFATSFEAFPLQFTYAGTAESPDGKADMVEVRGAGEFTATLFIDQKSHLPLMLSWMAKEPISLSNPAGAPGTVTSSGGVQTRTMTIGGGGASAAGAGGQRMTPADIATMQQEMDARVKEAEAKARIVEYRVFYGNYQIVEGVKLPTTFSRSIDGKATEELTIEKYKLNTKVDPKAFEVVK
jgi:hypothetical protein